MICPQCGYERRKSDDIISPSECPKCGIIYSKWKPPASDTGMQPVSSYPDKRRVVEEPRKKISIERMVIYAGIAVVLIILMHSFLVPSMIKFIKMTKNEATANTNIASSTENKNSESDNLHKVRNEDLTESVKSVSGRDISTIDAQNVQSSYPGSSGNTPAQGREVYCFADGNGQVSFVAWRTGMQVSRPDGTLDRMKFERWALEQVGGNPEAINPDKDARDDVERNREQLFKSVFPSRSMSDTNLTSGEKGWLERRYQKHYIEIYNQRMAARNEAIRKYNLMMHEFDRFNAGRK